MQCLQPLRQAAIPLGASGGRQRVGALFELHFDNVATLARIEMVRKMIFDFFKKKFGV
jgi:hypothetical protein